MNRAAAKYYPFQVISRFMINRPGEVFYIGGNDILPAPLPPEQEASAISLLNTDQEKEAKAVLIEHNLRLVVYIAKKFDNIPWFIIIQGIFLPLVSISAAQSEKEKDTPIKYEKYHGD